MFNFKHERVINGMRGKFPKLPKTGWSHSIAVIKCKEGKFFVKIGKQLHPMIMYIHKRVYTQKNYRKINFF